MPTTVGTTQQGMADTRIQQLTFFFLVIAGRYERRRGHVFAVATSEPIGVSGEDLRETASLFAHLRSAWGFVLEDQLTRVGLEFKEVAFYAGVLWVVIEGARGRRGEKKARH